MKNVRFTNDLTIGLNNANESTWGQFSDWVRMNPYWKPYDDNGRPVYQYTFPTYAYPILNPLYDALQTSFIKSEYLNIRNTTNVSVDIMQGLRADFSFGVTQQRDTGDTFYSPKSSMGKQSNGRYLYR